MEKCSYVWWHKGDIPLRPLLPYLSCYLWTATFRPSSYPAFASWLWKVCDGSFCFIAGEARTAGWEIVSNTRLSVKHTSNAKKTCSDKFNNTLSFFWQLDWIQAEIEKLKLLACLLMGFLIVAYKFYCLQNFHRCCWASARPLWFEIWQTNEGPLDWWFLSTQTGWCAKLCQEQAKSFWGIIFDRPLTPEW